MRQTNGRRWIGPLQVAIIILVVITALVHFQRAFGMMGGGPPGGAPRGAGGPPPGGGGGGFNVMQLMPFPLSTMFLLNGIGYLVLVAALYLPPLQQFHRPIRWVLILFTALTFVLYFMFAGLHYNPIGYFDKLVEIVLIALLVVEDRQSAPARVSRVYG